MKPFAGYAKKRNIYLNTLLHFLMYNYLSFIGHQSTGSSAGSGADPSSSELSADTVIYMGPSDDATDGEHPPVYLPSLSSGDNRCVMSKALKGSGLEKQQQSPAKSAAGTLKKTAVQKGK